MALGIHPELLKPATAPNALTRRATNIQNACYQIECLPPGASCPTEECLDAVLQCLVMAVFSPVANNVSQEEQVCQCFHKACAQNSTQTAWMCSSLYLPVPGAVFFLGWNSSWSCDCPDKSGSRPLCVGEFCSETTKKCVALFPVGARCNSSSQCEGYNCNSTTNRCDGIQGERYPRDDCTSPEQCSSNRCVGNKCQGFGATERCSTGSECDVGLYCSNASGVSKNTCVRDKTFGEPCDPKGGIDGGPCVVDLICLTETSTCGAFFGGAKGDRCTNVRECALGDYCAPNGCGTLLHIDCCRQVRAHL
jgi:hypothetical protein